MIGKKKGFFSQPDGSADLRSPEKEVYFRSWDLANLLVLVAQLKYTKNLYKNWIFRKFKYARKEEFYAPIICFG